MLKESSFVLTFPLWILVVGSIFFGYLAREFFIGIGVNSFVLNFSQESSINFSSEVEIFNLLKKVFFIFCFTVLPMILFFTDYYKNKKRRNLVYRPQFVQHKLMLWRDIYLYKNYRNFRIINIYSFLSSKWGFDVIFNKFFFIFLYTHVSLSVYELLDKFILESFFGHRQFITIMKNFSLTFKPLIHSGRIYYYFLSFLILALFII
jgi:NADH:ubiquinone oxidoreductase subunit 5 (subunit L)/multisubunit Na+/H+ antiporter MnhA subunit